MIRTSICALAIPLVGSLCFAQLPTPNPTPAKAPRAHWSLTTGVTGTPTQRRDNPGAASQDKLYVFGGRLGNATSTVLNALYEFDGKAWTLKTAEGAAGAPPKRGGASVAWDHGRNKLIVFGGDGGSSTTYMNDTWEWDLTTNKWTQITSTNSPSKRRYAAMAWDPITKGMVLFGGMPVGSNKALNDTWLLLNGQWIPRSPVTVPPGAYFHSLMTRPNYKDIVMCSGADNSTTPVSRHFGVWRWSGANWFAIPVNKTVPHATLATQAVYDQARKRIVLQGGNGLSTYSNNAYGKLYGGSPSGWTSEFDFLTNEWKLYGAASFNTADPVIGRTGRYFAGYVPALGKVYKVSGQNPTSTGTKAGTCEYQATTVASAVDLGKGCSNVALAGSFPNERPWLGRTFKTETTGLVTGSAVIGIVGFKQLNLPLKSILAAGGTGCDLYSFFDILVVLPNVAGTAKFDLPLPADVKFAGAKIYHQVLQFEFAGTALKSFTSSNGLTLTLGAL
jgi:Galactose oxidase, central domain